MTHEDQGQGENLVVIYRAPDEVIANIIKGLLVGEDIPVVLESKMVPWMDGVMKTDVGYWGDVVVPEQYAERSKELIAGYQASVTDEDVTSGDDQPNQI